MASTRKHGTHSIVKLKIGLLAAAAAADPNDIDTFIYEAFSGDVYRHFQMRVWAMTLRAVQPRSA